jgi:hypothetical protein
MSTVVEHSPLPSRHAIRNLLEDLTGREMEIGDGLPPATKSTNVVAVYVTDKLATSAVIVLDLEGAARLGGALAMVPRGGVEDAITERDLSGALKDNCYEVVNVMASIFNVPGAPHVRLYQMYAPNEAVPSDIAAFAANPGSRMDVELKIQGYGTAQMSVVVQ